MNKDVFDSSVSRVRKNLEDLDKMIHWVRTQLIEIQKDRPDGAVSLSLKNCNHEGQGCISCPHPLWKILHLKNYRPKEPGTKPIPTLHSTKYPAKSGRARADENVMGWVMLGQDLIETRRKFVAAISQMNRMSTFTRKKIDSTLEAE